MSVGLPLEIQLTFRESSPEPKSSSMWAFCDDISDPKKFTPKLPSLVACAVGPEPFSRAEAMGLIRAAHSPMKMAPSSNTSSSMTSSPFSTWGIDSKALQEFLAPILTKKTAFALCWIVCCAIWNSVCQAVVDHWTFFNEFHVADTQFSDPAKRLTLPDLGFHLLPHVTTEHIADHWNVFMIIATFAVWFPALGHFRARALQRFCLIQGLCFLVRSFSILITFLPNPYQSCALNPARDESFFIQGLKVMGGQRFTCGDVMYSGHSVNMTLMNMIWQQYLPKEWSSTPLLKAFWWFMNIGGLLCCVATHFHYSVDCYLGFIVAFSFWTIYHLALNVPRSHDTPVEGPLGWLSPVRVFMWIEDDLDDDGLLVRRSASQDTKIPLQEVICGKSLEENDEKANLLDSDVENTREQAPQRAV